MDYSLRSPFGSSSQAPTLKQACIHVASLLAMTEAVFSMNNIKAIRKKSVVEGEGSGGQGSVHSTSMAMAEGLAAWALANDKMSYAPMNSQDKVLGLSNVAQALNHEL